MVCALQPHKLSINISISILRSLSVCPFGAVHDSVGCSDTAWRMTPSSLRCLTVLSDYPVRAECQQEMLEHRRFLLESYQLTPDLASSCEQDIAAFCGPRLQPNGKTLHCLMRHARPSTQGSKRLSDQCRRQVSTLLWGCVGISVQCFQNKGYMLWCPLTAKLVVADSANYGSPSSCVWVFFFFSFDVFASNLWNKLKGFQKS